MSKKILWQSEKQSFAQNVLENSHEDLNLKCDICQTFLKHVFYDFTKIAPVKM